MGWDVIAFVIILLNGMNERKMNTKNQENTNWK